MAQLPAHAAAAWEEDVLDLDDSDIRLDAPTVSPTSRSHENKPPHPSHHHRVPEPAAAAVQDATRLGSVARSPLAALGHGDVRAPDADFQLPPWLCALQFLGRDRAWEQPGIKAIKDKETLCRAPLVAGVVTSCKQNGLDNLLVTLKDVGSRTKNPTDTVAAAVHKKVLLEGNNNGQDISVGCVILPTKVAVFHPTCKACSLNLNKVIKYVSPLHSCSPEVDRVQQEWCECTTVRLWRLRISRCFQIPDYFRRLLWCLLKLEYMD